MLWTSVATTPLGLSVPGVEDQRPMLRREGTEFEGKG